MLKIIAKNKKIFLNYEIFNKFQAGIQLKGWEVKSIKNNKVSLNGTFCYFKNNELFVSNMHVSLYMHIKGDETALKKLLLKKAQLNKIKNWVKVQGNSIVPISIFLSEKKWIKLEIALVKGKKKFDKREMIKKRDMERKIKKIF